MLCLDTLSVQSEHNQNTRSVRAEAGPGLVWGSFTRSVRAAAGGGGPLLDLGG